MKKFTHKWFRRFSVLIAIKLFVLAIALTLLRLMFIWVDDYKEDLAAWVAGEYQINLSAANVSAGVDFSGLVIILNDIELQDSPELPFALSTDYLFLHLDFWESLTKQTLNFNRFSLQGVDLTLKKLPGAKAGTESVQSLPTLDSLRNIFLRQLDKFSVKDSRIHFQTHAGVDKTIVIENLRWLNKGNVHQGIGTAFVHESLRDNSLQFILNLSGEKGEADNPLHGTLYVEADNLNIRDYLTERVAPDVRIDEAVLGLQAWAEFSATKLLQAQLVINDSRLAWSQLDKQHNWQFNSGLLQLTNHQQQWLLDGYDLDIEHNQQKLQGLTVTGNGTAKHAQFAFNALYLKDLLPFYLLHADLPKEQLSLLQALDIDGDLQSVRVTKRNADKLHFGVQLAGFKNRPQGALPGLSNAQIELSGNASQGAVNIKLGKQQIYFDGQFSRAMPVELGDLALRWSATEQGFKLYSEQSLLKTTDLDTITEFSLLFPNQQASDKSPFLSLYSYASLNDAAKAQYYYPVKVMKEKLFAYLQPTLKKGQIQGAKILWYGRLKHYPYKEHDGIFQAWVPLRDGQYDFYGKWQGLTNLDLDLLFENDRLTMKAQQASLGKVKVHKLSANIDRLHPTGMLTVNADIKDDAQKISDYLKNSPLQESVGKALTVIDVDKPLSGQLRLKIPFKRNKQPAETLGEITLSGNDININLADNSILPLKNAQGKFSFSKGNLTANKITAQLFKQDLQLAFTTAQEKDRYRVNVDMDGAWNMQQLSDTLPQLQPLRLSGILDWTGNVSFEKSSSGDYKSNTLLSSAAQGVKSNLPFPFNKNALQSWPSTVSIFGDGKSTLLTFTIKDKLDFIGELDQQQKQPSISYYALNIGADKLVAVDPQKHSIKIGLEKLNLSDWYQLWRTRKKERRDNGAEQRLPSIEADQLLLDIKHATLFEQPLAGLKVDALRDKQKWSATIASDNLQGSAEYRSGVPVRLDLAFNKLNFQSMDLSSLAAQTAAVDQQLGGQSEPLQNVYPEVFAKCTSCIYGDYDFSPLQLHIYPNRHSLNIDYIDIGTKNEFTHIAGVWDQHQTDLVIDSRADKNNSIVRRLGFSSPMVYKKAQLNGNLSWLGAPWQLNAATLNGAFSASLEDGSITEVSDKGARLLSLFSLNAIRRTLNLEFNDVFDKGLNFDDFSLSAKIRDGIVKNNDFYLNGSAGKIIGSGELDLADNQTDYEFSYSPAVTSSLPVLTAFAINPLTGAAVLMMSKLLEPVVDTIVRVDFSVRGPLNEPAVKLISREKGKVRLENSEVLEELNELQLKDNNGVVNNE